MADGSEFVSRINPSLRYKAHVRIVPRFWSQQRPPDELYEATLPDDTPEDQFSTKPTNT